MMTTNKVLDLISQQLDVIRAALKLDESDTEIENIEALIAEVEIEVEEVSTDASDPPEDREIALSEFRSWSSYDLTERSTPVKNGEIEIFVGSADIRVVKESQVADYFDLEMPLELSKKQFFAPRDLASRWGRAKGSLTARSGSIARNAPHALRRVRVGDKYRYELLDEHEVLERLHEMESRHASRKGI
jgi:hypothetical protein